MRSVIGVLGGSLRWSGRWVLDAFRMAAWTILSGLRPLVKLTCGLLTISGWVGGVVLLPALLAYGNASRGSDFGWPMFAGSIGVGLAMGLLAPMASVRYDNLLFWLEPKDRVTVYY